MSNHISIPDVATSAPPLAVAGMTWAGYSISDWAQVLAVVWLLLQIAYFVWSKFIRKAKPE